MGIFLRNITIIFSLLIFEGCAMNLSTGRANLSEELNYSVMVINEGDYEIEVFPFKLHNLEEMSVGVGIVIPGGKKRMGKYFYRPERNHIIQWKALETGKVSEAKVVVDLPVEFNKRNGSTIRFFINPNGPSVKVIYKIFDEGKNTFIEVEG